MKKFFTRHMSLKRKEHYKLLSTSDSQLASRSDEFEGNTKHIEQTENENESYGYNLQRRKQWRRLSRFKKRIDSEKRLEKVSDTMSSIKNQNHAAKYEIGVEVSPWNDNVHTFNSHARLRASISTSMSDKLNDVPNVDIDHVCENVHGHVKRSYLQNRRFGICEELERGLIMNDGVNLRKSRKNLVIRQVLHDLLLL